MNVQLDGLPVDVKADVLSLACDRPSAVRKSTTVSRRFAATIRLYGEKIWSSALREVRWPPSTEALRKRYLAALLHRGHHCRRLEVNLWTCPSEDIMTLAKSCRRITSLKMDGIGADGVSPDIWFLWGRNLEEIALRFFYYSDDGAPAIQQVLLQLACHSGSQLRRLEVSGFDYPGAKPACHAALNARRGHFSSLKRIRFRCSDDFQFQDHELADLRHGRPGCVIEVETYNTSLTGC
eukprot:TRINITY_DN114112_c0_g1_i1.p2 TRINITY_DN114112_c0_g1~~TRINITY_DN114112_c0_g1_i1.p2  ORF type:complete len:237 (-),score=30.23 TRINITY_DN114112_c0_g1_i1:111-821(-)